MRSLALLSVALIVQSTLAVVLHTSGRWILNASNQRVKLRCVNWAGHMEVNIPEGLQHQPVATIAQWVASNGFNCVRLTYSIDMALNPNQTVSASFTAAGSSTGVGSAAIQSLYNTVVSKNPWISSSTTLGAFARVIDELGSRNVLVILDNHLSRAKWCCGTTDGNGWWASAAGYNAANSQYFIVSNWLNGLAAMARFAASHANVVGMSLRNELRAVSGQDGNNHADWYTYSGQGAAAIHNANANLLIAVGGTSYALDLSFLGSRQFDRTPYGNKVIWEFHNYQWSYNAADCSTHQSRMGQGAGYLLVQNQAYTGPLWLSEFGWAQSNPTSAEVAYYTCLVSYMKNNDAEFAYWALMGSYYVRDSAINRDESFGLLNNNWSGWRNSNFLSILGSMMNQTQGP